MHRSPTADPAPSDVQTAPSTVAGPVSRGGHAVWHDARESPAGRIEVRFVGKSASERLDREGSRGEILEAVEGKVAAPPVASARQIHSDRVLPAERAGHCGEGDALWTRAPGLALSIITADCVPVLLADLDGPALAAVHAGWRGIAAGVVPATVERLRREAGVDPARLAAWVGPAIGVGCYEVSEEVADQVAAAAGSGCVVARPPAGSRPAVPRRRPHLDLAGSVVRQLEAAGAPPPAVVVRCTRCDAERLWSYRRLGKGAGRNVAYVWRSRP